MDFSNPLIAYFSVFLAGLIASFSPCVLSTIPLVLGFVGGYSEGDIKKSFLYSLLLSLGLSLTYTLLGLIAALLGRLLGDVGGFWQYILGLVAVLMGLQLLGVLNFEIPSINILNPKRKGLWGAFIVGMLFGVVASPCSTPILAIILTFVASKQNIPYGVSLLFIYALANCAVIFILGASIGFTQTILKSTNIQKTAYYLRKISGIILVLLGVYFFIFFQR